MGQDTDAESDPFEVGLGWMVKDDKDDFLGLRALRDLKERGPEERLVGFTAPDGWLPPEGASVVRDGTWVGRVTSARRSAAVGSVIGLAWVPADWAVRREHVRDPVRGQPHDGHRAHRSVLRPPRAEVAVVRTAIRRSPAARLSSRRGAVFVEEAGWEIPASYGDDEAERAAIRDRVAIADVTARAKVDVRGRIPEALPSPADTVLARISAEWVVVFGGPDAEARLIRAIEPRRRLRRDGDGRDPPVRRLRAGRAGAARRAGEDHVVGSHDPCSRRGDRSADRRRFAR